MACPYCTKLYFILTVFVAPQCGGTLFFLQWGQKAWKFLWTCQQSKTIKSQKKKTKSYFWNETHGWQKCLMWLPTIAASLTFSVFSKSFSGIIMIHVCYCIHTVTRTTKFTLKKRQYFMHLSKWHFKMQVTSLQVDQPTDIFQLTLA